MFRLSAPVYYSIFTGKYILVLFTNYPHPLVLCFAQEKEGKLEVNFVS